MRSDASVAIGIGMRNGVGKMRQLVVSQRWLQDTVANGASSRPKLVGEENLIFGVPTKHINATELGHRCKGVRGELASNRRDLALRP